MSLAERIADGLGGKKRTPTGYNCKCPCHDDGSASLSIKETEKGIILNCFAGCTWQDIKAAIQERGLLPSKSPARTGRYDGAIFYHYRDLVGNLLCRKVKLPSKKMWFERLESGTWIPRLEGMTVPLYNIQAVIPAPLVYLCEGEKDAETLITAGFVATTNHAGAKSWANHLTEQLRGKTVILIPDHDEAGRKRIGIVSKALHGAVKELRVFTPDGVADKGDITDWIKNGGDPNTILERSIVVEKRKENKKATHDEYYELFESALDGPRCCIFSEKLMHWDSRSQIWNPAINALDRIRAAALIANESRDSKFVLNHITPFFFAFEATKPHEFLVDIPEWDGDDRISAMAYLVRLRSSGGITTEAFSELLKEWCAKMFQRLHDPMKQNRILVLQGAQGIGKDTWTSMLVDGLGQFSVPLAVVKEDKDTYLNLHRGLVMKISEFDKTARTEVSTLKDIITAPSTNLRAPYDKDSKLRLSRCSFISSANAENLLRDPTGNRRFMIFECESIEYAYHGWDNDRVHTWQMQCLAEMVRLAELDYTASPESWRMMHEYIEAKTPDEYSVEVMGQFLADTRSWIDTEIMPNESRIREVVSGIAKQNGMKFGTVKSMIQAKIGVFRRIGDKRFWVWRIPERESVALDSAPGLGF